MNISIDTNARQDLVIQYAVDQYNASLPKDAQGNPINPLTPRQYVLLRFRDVFDSWDASYRASRLQTVVSAYESGNDAKRSAIEQAAQ